MMNFNDGLHIEELMVRSACQKHAVPKGVACWNISGGTGSIRDLRAVCGHRIRIGGYNGKITETSLALKKNSHKKEVRA